MTYLPGTKSRRRVYLMRHGHVDYLARHVVATGGINIVPLTNRGRLQAEAAGVALSHVKIDKAVCSGYPRTHQTASHVLAAQKNPPVLEIDEGLVERAAGTIPPVKSREELIEAMRGRYTEAGVPQPGERGEGGEAAEVAQERAVAAIRRLLRAPEWHTALVVAHEGINRLILSWACGAGVNATGAFEQDTGCINMLDFDLREDGEVLRTMIKAVNLTPYNWLKHGMNLTSLEALFERNATEELK
ncbi:MAG: histidine phosphatase family protein [Alphaproteobacteria bacterium]|nr:histidine phosphatase family protein [Alphaproteobacteria bacterium]MBL6939591.1 histidine phosphatase family protein [Alphaproteobacteria bacterium]MBL7100036.1 histidine phosphatase family protein [Alphaproteobacteria bacterium]